MIGNILKIADNFFLKPTILNFRLDLEYLGSSFIKK